MMESIFGIDVGICALHDGGGVQEQEGSQRASAGCASLHGMAPIFIGAWKDVMHIDGGGGEIRYGKPFFLFFSYAASARSTGLTPARCLTTWGMGVQWEEICKGMV